jgi:predicted regulator of Ras-like GTPase activity (Roadblock/LC7/MglB family)
MPHEAMNHQATNGFGGEISGMTLADLLQIKNISRFTGCLSVDHGEQRGNIFFRDGELVHAELNDLEGIEAFFSIIHWTGGEFRSTPKLATTCHTIRDNFTYLLLEAHRLKDELGKMNSIPTTTEQPTSTSLKGVATMSDINTKLKEIPEVEYAVVLNKAGNPTDDDSYDGATHAANSYFLSLFAGKLGNQLGAGEMISASVQGHDHHLLVFQSKNHFLSVTVDGSSQLGSIESNVRKTLSQK